MDFNKIESNIHTRNYLLSEIYRIVNLRQATLFIKNGVYPIDIYASKDKTGNDILVYVFEKTECKDVFEKWNNRTLV